MTWQIRDKGHPYNSDGGWEAFWAGTGKPPQTPFGTPCPVFNTSQRKARACANEYNSYIGARA